MFDNLIKQTKDDVDNVTRNTGKCSGNVINKVTETKVSTDNYNDVLTSDNNDIENDNVIKNVVSESDTLKIDSEIVSERERSNRL